MISGAEPGVAGEVFGPVSNEGTTMVENSNEGAGERRIGPSVSRDKWLSHARTKLQRGYVLIVGNGRRTANFYSRDKGYEMCAFDIARALVNSGEVLASGEHYLGTVYTLTDTAPPQMPQPRPAVLADDSEDTTYVLTLTGEEDSFEADEDELETDDESEGDD